MKADKQASARVLGACSVMPMTPTLKVKPYTLTVTGFRPCRLLRSAEKMDDDIVQLMSSDETLLALAGCVQIRSQLEVSTVSIPHPPAAPCGLLPCDGD